MYSLVPYLLILKFHPKENKSLLQLVIHLLKSFLFIHPFLLFVCIIFGIILYPILITCPNHLILLFFVFFLTLITSSRFGNSLFITLAIFVWHPQSSSPAVILLCCMSYSLFLLPNQLFEYDKSRTWECLLFTLISYPISRCVILWWKSLFSLYV